jgi:hypothetical protein
LIRLIGLGELLSVISHLLQSQFQFYGWGWEQVKNTSWVWEILLQEHVISMGGGAWVELHYINIDEQCKVSSGTDLL